MKQENKIKKNKYKLILLGILIVIILISTTAFFKTQTHFYSNENNEIKKINEDNLLVKDRYTLNNNNNTDKKIININLEAKESEIPFKGDLLEVYSYNDLSPGPIIIANVQDTLNVTLINNLNEDTTIHWHGLQLPNNMDGVPDITQDPVKPGEKFNYLFELKNQGIYWYHSHVNTAEQVGRGLYGILIVKDKNDTLKFDKEQVLILDDLRLDRNNQIASFGSMMDTHMSGRYGNTYFINGNTDFNINSEKGSLIKIDLINPSNARIFNFAIEKHLFVVVGNDIGRIEKPYETDSLILAPGERAEIIVFLNNTNKDNFELLNLAARNPEVIGHLVYSESDNLKYNNLDYYKTLIKEKLNSNLPDWSSKIDLEPDIIFNLYSTNNEDGFKWTINGNYYPENPDIQELEEGKFYKLRYTSKQNMIHPMHLHGQKFIILARNGIPVNDTMYRDTALVFPGESVDIGLIAEGEGSWVNHCHILEHAEAGMLGVINIK